MNKLYCIFKQIMIYYIRIKSKEDAFSMKKTGKRVIAVVLAVVMTLSLYTVGAVAIVSLLKFNHNHR